MRARVGLSGDLKWRILESGNVIGELRDKPRG